MQDCSSWRGIFARSDVLTLSWPDHGGLQLRAYPHPAWPSSDAARPRGHQPVPSTAEPRASHRVASPSVAERR
eukprot:210370-Chlamydomonas_euryale.AAC.1